jgi:rod shape-determining protein MreC
MQNIFSFFWRNHYFILFLILEFFCFSLILRSNFYQKSVVFVSANAISGGVVQTFSVFTDYLHLREINTQLAEENAMLKSYHKSSFIYDDRETFQLNDTIYHRKFTYVPAKVINNSIHRPNNFITLNIGSDKGVKPGMGVLSPSGVVGIVKDVSSRFSTVYSILNSESKISGKVGSDDIIGTVLWPGRHYRLAELKDIARYYQIERGDTVFTSNFSQIFPANIPIGFITDFSVNKAYDFYEIAIMLATDFSKVSDVYVIISHKNDEQVQLENALKNE